MKSDRLAGGEMVSEGSVDELYGKRRNRFTVTSRKLLARQHVFRKKRLQVTKAQEWKNKISTCTDGFINNTQPLHTTQIKVFDSH